MQAENASSSAGLDAYDAGAVLARYRAPRLGGAGRDFQLYADRVVAVSHWRRGHYQEVTLLHRLDPQPQWARGHRGHWQEGLKKGFWPGLAVSLVSSWAFRAPWVGLPGLAVFLAIALPDIIGSFRPLRWASFQPRHEGRELDVVEDPHRSQEWEAFVLAVSRQIQKQPPTPAAAPEP